MPLLLEAAKVSLSATGQRFTCSVCGGFAVDPVRVAVVIIRHNKTVIHHYDTLCLKCSLYLEEFHALKRKD